MHEVARIDKSGLGLTRVKGRRCPQPKHFALYSHSMFAECYLPWTPRNDCYSFVQVLGWYCLQAAFPYAHQSRSRCTRPRASVRFTIAGTCGKSKRQGKASLSSQCHLEVSTFLQARFSNLLWYLSIVLLGYCYLLVVVVGPSRAAALLMTW